MTIEHLLHFRAAYMIAFENLLNFITKLTSNRNTTNRYKRRKKAVFIYYRPATRSSSPLIYIAPSRRPTKNNMMQTANRYRDCCRNKVHERTNKVIGNTTMSSLSSSSGMTAEPMESALKTNENHVTFARALACPDKKIRDKTLKTLVNYLAALDQLSDLEMLKLWKALYYCMWLADKVPIQMELAGALSSELFRSFSNIELAYNYIRMFFRTLMREWHYLDQHRINKFYILVRYILREMMLHMCMKRWAAPTVTALLTILEEEVLSKTPNGPRLHVADIFLEELWMASAGAESVDSGVFIRLLGPFLKAVQSSPDGVYQERVSKQVFGAFATSYARELAGRRLAADSDEGDEDDEDEENEQKLYLSVRTAVVQAKVFELASDSTGVTLEKNRRKLYALHQVFPPVTGKPFADENEELEAETVSKSKSKSKSKGASVDAGRSSGSGKTKEGSEKMRKLMVEQESIPTSTESTKKRKAVQLEEATSSAQAPALGEKKKIVVAASALPVPAVVVKKQKVDSVQVTQSAAPAAASKETATATLPLVPFVASKKFDGRRLGYVFKTGTKGLGYYQDAREMKLMEKANAKAKLGSVGGLGKGGKEAHRRHSTGNAPPASASIKVGAIVSAGAIGSKSKTFDVRGSTGSSGSGNGGDRRLSGGNSSGIASSSLSSSAGCQGGRQSVGGSDMLSPKKVTFGKPQVRSFDKLSSASTVSAGDSGSSGSNGRGNGGGSGGFRAGSGHGSGTPNKKRRFSSA